MKAIISERYGQADSLTLREVVIPSLDRNQVLVKVHASSINFGNLVLLTGKPLPARLAFGLLKPKYSIPGGDVAGIVEAVGENVTGFQIGDEVFGDLSTSGWGAFAQYTAANETSLALKPSNLTFAEAAAVPMAGATALQAIRDSGKLAAGMKVLLHGASGGVGTFAIQIAKVYGAEVTAVVSTRNTEMARALGADHVLDYQKENLENHEQTYDVIFGVNGAQPLSVYNRLLKENGQFIHVGGESSQMYQTLLKGSWLSMVGKKKYSTFLHRTKQEDLLFLKEQIEAGKIRPIIDREYSLQEVPKAIQYFEKGRSQGKVIISVFN
ncbi:NAD(P)-dependent alcohol dehydrogenase [Bacillus mesophilum]|uniref:NAD(P)-dependent alcohol dehydrogenase n=1 Tax=Bacillus mesophilum TaxID=1071718 RepID=A0A7V7RJR7_9BACI|nr:NAD(P)-dependent alcohol dehydrogenase [Bacillus mesophilum]KAB2331280.1 NAD(P)-dependent alcohol dehydrogenase [Bacillus mesophilum]